MQLQGDGETITGQIPMPGQSLPGGSQVMVYLGEAAPERTVEVPDFTGMNRQQASDTAGKLGLYIQISGNPGLEPTVTVTSQSIQKDTQVPPGTTIQLEFTDPRVRD